MCKNLIRLIILTLVTCMITGCLFGCILGKEEVSETDPSVSSDTVTEGTETSSIETDESEATESETEEAEATEEGSTESETEIAVFELTAKNLAFPCVPVLTWIPCRLYWTKPQLLRIYVHERVTPALQTLRMLLHLWNVRIVVAAYSL